MVALPPVVWANRGSERPWGVDEAGRRPIYVVPEVLRRRNQTLLSRPGRFLFPGAALAVLGAFLAAPWPLAHKTHLALHGLCAQRPSHSLYFGGDALPFDARMTGIYGGFLVTAGYLLARRRFRPFRLPPARVMAILALFVAAMAFDGTNSLLVDLGLHHWYEPDNRLRVATGLLTGIALATVLSFLLATTLWREGEWQQAPLGGVRELVAVTALQLPFVVAVASGVGVLFAPLALALVLAAVLVVGTLVLVVVVLVTRRDRSFDAVGQLHVPMTVALLIGLVVMAGFAGGRVLLERLANVPPLT